MYTVYVHISPSNKYYIGITSRSIKERFNYGKGYHSSKYFNNAIKKYGWDNFQHEIIASNITKKEASNFEQILIEKLKTNNINYGYNICSGGVINKHTKLYKENLSKRVAGKNNPMYNVRRYGNDNPMYGKVSPLRGTNLNEHIKQQISNTMKEKYKLNPKEGKPVFCITTKKYFESLKEASIFYNIKASNLSATLNGRQKTCGKQYGISLQWKYAEGEHLKYEYNRN